MYEKQRVSLARAAEKELAAVNLDSAGLHALSLSCLEPRLLDRHQRTRVLD